MHICGKFRALSRGVISFFLSLSVQPGKVKKTAALCERYLLGGARTLNCDALNYLYISEPAARNTGGFLFVTAMSHFRTQSCLCKNYMTYLNETWHGLPFYHKEENHRRDF